jgi:hypothetical protein
MRRTTLIVLIVILGNLLYAQKVAVKKVELAGEKIIVHYDLEDNNPNNDFQISLYSSQNNFSTALTHVKGDVGSDVKAGANKKIEWSIREELGPYKGKLSLEIRGKVFTPFVKLQNFDVSKKYKRGKSYPLSWKANTSTPIHIELFKGSQRVTGDLNHPNNGAYSLTIPSNSKPGKDYRLKFTDSRGSDEIIYSSYFSVTPKVPMLLKIAPVLVVGGVAYLVFGGKQKDPKDDDDTDIDPTEIELPGFPTSGN